MSTNLVIVESPAKAKTLTKYLGKDFHVIASYGHIRDLIPKSGAVDPDNNFDMHYQIIDKNKKYASAVSQALKKHQVLYLATDPDREGEAIAWHIYEFLKEQCAKKTVHRITFHEITEKAVKNAIEAPKSIAMPLVEAQQARRALDYLVGFTLSPLLWKKVRPGLSAGRVQSPALRLIVEREIEIEVFNTQEYWSIPAKAEYQKQPFEIKLAIYKGTKLKQFSVTNADEARNIQASLLELNARQLTVDKIEKKERKRNPAAPFITSTLQQEASHKLGFTAKRTMLIAQQLYEGIEMQSGAHTGLITYMRTDSTSLSQEAIHATRHLIKEQFGSDGLPTQARKFQTKSKNAQEAHEAIRPTDVSVLPQQLKSQLSTEQFRLYELIWKRTVASQMQSATLESVAMDFNNGQQSIYRVTGTTILKPGFMSVYLEFSEESGVSNSDLIDKKSPLLPKLKVGDTLQLIDVQPKQHFTEPPPRYNEASLIKTLEAHGIGRPSTYVPIISTLQQRSYVTHENKRFQPTDVGRIVHQFLTNYFQQYIDYDFTATLEESLDEIARGEKTRVPILENFWKPFQEKISEIEANVKRQEVTQEVLEEQCPECQKNLTKRLGKRGLFVGCSGYPECNYTRSLESDATEQTEPESVKDRQCPTCNSELHIKVGKYGKFIGCSQYPKCKHIEPLEKPTSTQVQCPECEKGDLLKRKSRYGKLFYSCEHYPKCQYAIWHPPLEKACPKCQWPLLTIKVTKRKGTEHICPQKSCHYAVSVENNEIP